MAISFVQQVGVRVAGDIVSAPFASPNTAGSLLTAIVPGGSTGAPTNNVVDSAGNTWLLGVQAKNGTTQPTVAIWYAVNAIGGTNTVQVTNPSTASAITVHALEWSGVSTAVPLQAVSSNAAVGTSTSHTPGSVSPSASTSLFLVAYAFDATFDITNEPPTGYSTLISTFVAMQAFYKIVSGSTTTEDPQANTSNARRSANVIAAFSGGTEVPGSGRRRGLTLLGVS